MLALAVAAAGQCAFAIDVNDEAGLRNIANDLAGEYTLTSDILLTGPWAPLGSDATPFTGKINGNGHVIKGLYVIDQETARNAFINSAKGATITKLGLDDVNVLGNEDVGGLLGKDKGGNTITECFVSGKISGRDHVGALIGGCTNEDMSTVENCYALAYVHSRNCQTGGLVGTPIDLEMNNCYFAGTLFADYNCIGGIASLVDGETEGRTSFTLNNSFAASPLILRNNISWGAQGRVLGNNGGKSTVLENNYALASTRIGSYTSHALVESDDVASNDGASKTLAELTSPDFIANTLGWDATVWTTAAGILPRLAWQKEAVTTEAVYVNYNPNVPLIEAGKTVFLGAGTLPGAVYTSSNPEVATIDNDGMITGVGNGTTTITVSVPADATQKGLDKTYDVKVLGVVYEITNPDQLSAMRFDLAGEYTLANDIDMSGVQGFEPIGTGDAPFTGKLNGNGHVIKNLNMAVTGDDKAFFGTANGAVIEKIGFENARVVWSGSGGANIAVVVGRATGVTIKNSYVANSYVYGRDHVASFVGGSFSGGEPTLIEDCYSTSRIQTSQYQVAGIMGTMINAHINRCHFSGMINAGGTNAGAFVSLVDAEADVNSVTNSICLAVKIEGHNDGSGRIIGNTAGRPTTMENNYGLETTSCAGSDNADDATLTGRQGQSVTLEEATDAAFYTEALGWDMENTWQMIPGSYPVLAWQTLPVTGTFFGLPDAITLIEGKGNFDLGDIKGNLAQEYDVEEVDTKYLRIRASVAVSKWPASTTTTAIRFTSQNADIVSTVEVPVTLIPASEASVKISTPEDLVAAAQNPGLDYVLTKDIDMKDVAFNGIGTNDVPFSGVFDGKGYSIFNITRKVSGNKHGGLFEVTNGATIKNLGVNNVRITGGSQDIGGIVGNASNTKVEQCYVTGYVEGADHVGGIFGGCKMSYITDCYVNGSIITTGSQVGGLSGVASGLEITNSYVAGEVIAQPTGWTSRSAGMIGMTESSGSSMVGAVSIANIAGGIIGHFLGTADGFDKQLAKFEKCLYSTDANYTPGDGNDGRWENYEGANIIDDSGNDWNTVPRCTASDGRTTEQLKTWSTYAGIGWSDEVWEMPAEGGFPVLKNVVCNEAAGIEGVAAEVESAVKVYGTTGAIVVEAAEATVNVYNFSGLFLGQFNVIGSATIELAPAPYIVNVRSAEGVKASKVLVR